MGSVYRTIGNRAAAYQASLRDKYIENTGIEVTIYKPNSENQLDAFGDQDTNNAARVESQIVVVPHFKDYYQIIDILGENVENDLPLEVQIKTTEHLPIDTLIQIPLPNKYAEEGEGVQAMMWRVLSVEQKHLDTGYSKVAKCVPSRDNTWTPS